MKTQFLAANAFVVFAAALSVFACSSDDEVTPPAGDGDGDAAGDGDMAGDGDGMGGAGDGDGREPWLSSGLATGGEWEGYIFTAAEMGSVIEPDELPGDEACVTGTLGPTFEEWGMVGWNIAQEIDPETFDGGAVNAVAPDGNGVSVVVVDNTGSSRFRVQIQSDEDGTEAWCADVLSTGISDIPWESFKKECWAPGGDVYDPSTPIAQVAVQIYSTSDSEAQDFDFCIEHLGPML